MRTRGISFGPGEAVSHKTDRPFQVVFVDFGMVVTIPERLRSALRDYAIGVGTRDAYRVVQAYADAGILLPSADLKRLEEATADMFNRTWGIRMGQVRDLAAGEMQYFMQEYRDIVYEAPFQFPVDLLFMFRAIGILSGMATNLDPDFDPWSAGIPFAERLAKEQLQKNWREWLEAAVDLGRMTLKLPAQIDRILTGLERGDLVVQNALAPNTRKAIKSLEQAVNRLTWVVLTVGLLISSVILSGSDKGGYLGTGLMSAALVVLVWGMLRER